MSDTGSQTLRQYVIAKQSVTSAVLDAGQFLEQYGGKELVERSHDLVVKLAQDRFNLAVVGQFKRGKSSLMNAIIGRDLLPTGMLPLTSAITALRYGPQERALLKFKGWSFESEITLNELPEYISERGNPGNMRGLLKAVVEIPSPFLRRGLYFVDTPGIGSSRKENTETTYEFLPEADAVIFVTSAEAPFSEAEQTFLGEIRQYGRKLFVVVNKMDLLAESEKAEVLGYLHNEIESIFGQDAIHLFSLSAKLGLEAKLASDQDTLERSGLILFEDELASFLASEKGKVFLVSILERMAGLLSQAKQRLISGSYEWDAQKDDGISREVLLGELEQLQTHLQRLRDALQYDGLLGPTTLAPNLDLDQNGAPVRPTIQVDQIIKKSQRVIFESKTCPICYAQEKAVFDFIATWQYEISTNEQTRQAFAAARGFCHFHTWIFQQFAAPQDLSYGYIPLVDQTAAELRGLQDKPVHIILDQMKTMFPGVGKCPACQVLRKTGEAQVALFIHQIKNPGGLESYLRSGGLCIKHLGAVLNELQDPEVGRGLIGHQIQRLEEISEDMHSYVLKRTAIHWELINDEEARAWRSALIKLSSERYVTDS